MNWLIDETENEFIIKIKQLNLKKENFKLVKFSDYFEKVKPKFCINNLNNLCKGPFPHFGAKNQNKPDCYVNVYNYEDDNLIRLNKMGNSAGYCYTQNGNCAVNNNCLCYKLKNNELNLKVTSLLLTNQFKKIYSYARPLNTSVLQTTECYVYLNDTNVSSPEFKIVGVIPKLKIDKTKIRKIKFSDYFEKIKPEITFTLRETNKNSGPIPLLSSTCQNNGIVKHINCYSIDLKEESLVINKNGSVGYCFVHSGKIAITTDVCVFKCLNKSINLRVSSILLTNQLRKQFNWSKKINDIRLKQLECYVYFN